ncbi:DUF11 domain-containing protein [Frankia sp. CNm7]|uniref:DUF11 domain-containing protein n=1 Tax=Frankia nepalensis TaxID=1836974 RepID=A0A937RFE9_9ACTN|nr:putative Ig domain-containing protein [Frankia nepalensis]MBL7497382.1 DUF11 domain-containing protein [Frankia nepalensis]MBL7512772.1 DUF11 domain-containing protein [Frankia nepalensis]MBL7522510.1 DUF11 domain-containing protein [Frankia nepalensis]MBL7629420.1 DUF11 domain-containing protein [Frankia nepalensis]
MRDAGIRGAGILHSGMRGRGIRRPWFTNGTAVVVLAVLLSGSFSVIAPETARAAGTVLFNQPFKNSTANGTGAVSLPALPASASGSNFACLSAAGNTTSGPLLSCTTNTDSAGSGNLRLTNATTSKEGGVFGATSVPTSQGLGVTFNSYQYGGGGADGLTFVVAAVNPASPTAPTSIGQAGGSLGYSGTSSSAGLAYGYLGFGMDVYGNFSSSFYQGSGCTNPAYISTVSRVPGQVVVRGPGNGTVGYCAINSTATSTSSSALALRASTRAASVVPVEVVINPTSQTLVSDSGLSAAAGTYAFSFTPVGGTARTLRGSLPTVSTSLFPSSWLSSGGIPRQLAFGWVGSTGAVTDFHEIDNARVVTFNPVPQLTVAATSYNGSAPQPGDPVTYTVSAGVSASGAAEAVPVSVTQTLPAGVVPVGAFGTGWVCQPPSGQSITCTNSNGPFAAGTTLPPLTVVAVVTGSGVTPTLIQTATTTTSSSTDANPGLATTTTPGTVPAAPTGLAISPTSGTISGGNAATITGTNLGGATAILIGTTAEQRAGTAVVLLPCQSGPAAGCFTVNANGSLSISSMPARATATAVTVAVVTAGVAGTTSYTYTSVPGTPAAPTATAGVSSATVSWTAPPANGSPITGYVVTPYLNGVAQAPRSFDATATSRILTGLTPGGSYTFTVTAVNAVGTGAPSPVSNAVVPYALPAAPTITAVSAGSTSATLSWTAPAANGSPITGYVVTPFIGGVAQTPQTFSATATTQTLTGLQGGTTYTFQVAAINAAGTGPASAASAPVTVNVSPSLNLPAPPPGEVGAAYSDQLTVTGGTAPFTWSVSSGSLPAGLTLNPSTGLISGTPTSAGAFTFTVRVVDASGQAAAQSRTVTIAAAPVLTFPAPPAGEVGVAYSNQLTLSGGTAPYTWSVSAGSLPAGLSLDAATGLISGTPTAAGTASFVVRVVDAFGQSAQKSTSITIAAVPSLDGPPPPTGQVGVAYSTSFPVTGGTGPYTWAVTAGSPPAGLTLNPTTGVLSGTPSAPGGSPFTIQVTDAFGQTATRTVTVTIATGPITVVSAVDRSSVAPGGTVAYTLTATNTSGTPFAGVALTESLAGVLDDATYDGNASATAGAVAVTGTDLTWTGDLAAGASAVISFSVTARSPATGDKVLASAVTSPTLGTTCPAGGTDPRCASTVTVSTLTLTSASDVASTVPGGTVTYTYTATNDGQTPFQDATFTVPLADVLDDAAYAFNGQASAGGLSFTGDSLVWTGALAPGASATVTASFTVRSPAGGDGALRATLVSATQGSTCPAGGTVPACATVVPVLTPGLSITSTSDVSSTTPGGTVGFTVTITNTGQTPYTGATVVDSLARVLTDAVYNGDAIASTGALSYTAPNLTWTGDLAVGASATIMFSVTVNDPDNGDRVLINTVSSPVAGSTCPTGGNAPACSTTVPVLLPALTVTAAASPATVAPGGTVTYTVTVTNAGDTPYTGTSTVTSLAGLLDDAVYNADAAATSGTVTYTAPNLTWTGDLAVGAAATITFSATAANPVAGDAVATTTTASTATGTNCPAGSADPRCSTEVPISALVLEQHYTGSTTTPGAVVRLNATFTNVGKTPYTGITVRSSTLRTIDDAIPNGDQVASSGTLILGPSEITWTGDIPVGGVVTITGTLTIRNPDPGDRTLTGTLVSTAPGNNCPAGGTDPRCTSLMNVLLPGLTLSRSTDVATTVPGGTVGYTVTISNTGQTPYTEVTVVDQLGGVLDDAVYNADAAATAGTVGVAGSALTWTGDVAVGATVTITFSVTARDPDPGDKLMTDSLVSTAVGGNCPPASLDAACAGTVAVLTPALTLVQTPDPTVAVPGQVIAYTVTATNSGQTQYPAATFTQSLAGLLDDAVYNADAAASSGSVSISGQDLTWTGGLAPGDTATVTFSVTVNNPDTGDRSLSSVLNSPTAGSNCPSGGTDPRCASTVTVESSALLTIRTESSAPTTIPGGTVTYTVTVTNGGLTPYSGAAFTADLTDVLGDATYNGDATADLGTVGYTAPTLSWSGTVPAGGTATITYSVTEFGGIGAGDRILVTTVASPSAGSNCPPGGTDSRCTTTVTTSELTLALTADTATATPGQVVQFTGTMTNTGTAPYIGVDVGVQVGGLIDDAASFGGQTASSGTFAFGPTGLVWTGNIGVGETVTVTGSARISDPVSGDGLLAMALFTDAPGSNCPPGSADPACSASVPVLVPGLTIVKTADRTFTTPGGTVGYTITVTNTGQTPYTGAVVTDPFGGRLDDADYNGDAIATAGTLSFANQALTWTGDLAVGAAAVITYTLTVHSPSVGDKLLVNSVSSTDAGSTCPPASGNPACTASVLILTPALTITRATSAPSAVPGATVTFTLELANTGQLPFPGAVVADSLAGVLDDATYNGDAAATAGTVGVTGPALTWTGDLAVGATVTITYSATVDTPDSGDHLLTATASSAVAGSNCAAGGTDPRCSVTVPVAELTIVTTPSASAVAPGDVLQFVTTITNTGAVPYQGATVTATLAGGLDDATYNGDAVTTSGALQFDVDSLTWTGDLPVGQSAVISASLTVNQPDTGDRIIRISVVSPTPGSSCPDGTTNPACSATVTVLTPGLTITTTANVSTITPGGTVGFTVVVTNTGETPYTGLVVQDDLAQVVNDATFNNDAVASSGAVGYAEPLLTWTGDLAPGASATITFSVTVDAPYQGDRTLRNVVRSSAFGGSCAGGPADPAGCAAVVTVLLPALTITKTADTGGGGAGGADGQTVVAGGPIAYTVTVANTGEAPYTGASFTDDLAGVLDDAAYNADAAADVGAVSFAGQALTWTGDLAVGAVATVTYSVTTALPGGGDHTAINQIASATAGANCATGGAPSPCATTTTILVPGLTIGMTADQSSAVVGSTVRYTITATNTGQSPYTGVVITDDLSSVLGNATYNADATASAGALAYTAPALIWTGDLPIGAGVVITFTATVSPAAPGGATLVNRVSSTAPGSTCTGQGVEPGCVATTAVEEQFLTLTDLTPTFTLAGEPNSTVSRDDAVTMTVTTNSATGYTVSVQAGEPVLSPNAAGNSGTIPVDRLSVRGTGSGAFQPLSDSAAVTVHDQDQPSAPGGDAISNDYAIDVPYVPSDVYSGTLDYVAATQ